MAKMEGRNKRQKEGIHGVISVRGHLKQAKLVLWVDLLVGYLVAMIGPKKFFKEQWQFMFRNEKGYGKHHLGAPP